MYLYRKKGQTANSLRKAKYKQSGREQLINSAACARSFNVSLCACMCEYERGSSRCKSFPLKTSLSQSYAAHSLLALSRALSLSFSGMHVLVTAAGCEQLLIYLHICVCLLRTYVDKMRSTVRVCVCVCWSERVS